MEYTIIMSNMLALNLNDFLKSESLVPLALVVIAIFFMMSSLRRRYVKPPKPRAEAEPGGPSRESVQRLRSEVESAIVELQDLSRRISSEIDVRFARLEAAIHDADRRIAALQRLVQEADAITAERTPREVMPLSRRDEESLDVRHALVYEMADGGRTPVEIARELGKTPGEVELILNLRRSSS